MVKILNDTRINWCMDCPFFHSYGSGDWVRVYCEKVSNINDKTFEIPNWCPLEDVKENLK